MVGPLSVQCNPICAICGKPVELEFAKTDEHGLAVHGDCYCANLTPDDASAMILPKLA